MIWSVTVGGDPAPKGSLKCIGQAPKGGRVMHRLIEDDKAGRGKAWRAKVTAAAVELRKAIGETLDGPLGLAIITVHHRPAAAAKRLLPASRSGHDVDKLSRMLMDALDDGDVFTDDSRVCFLTTAKVYELATRPAGAQIIMWPLASDEHTAQVMRHVLKQAPELA